MGVEISITIPKFKYVLPDKELPEPYQPLPLAARLLQREADLLQFPAFRCLLRQEAREGVRLALRHLRLHLLQIGLVGSAEGFGMADAPYSLRALLI